MATIKRINVLDNGIFFLIVVLLFGCTKASQKDKKSIIFSSQSISEIDSFANRLKEIYHVPGLAIAIVQGDSLFSSTYGIKNEKGEPLLVSTAIATGSLSEPVLAYAALRLVQDGKIDLKDKITAYLPYFKMQGEGYKKMRIHQLLTHSSGIENYTVFYDNPSFAPNAVETTTRSIQTQKPRWELPDVQILRSAYNYDILADLIGKVTKQPFENFVQQEIFRPIHMDNSAFYKLKSAAAPFYTSNYLNYDYKEGSTYPYNREHGGSSGLHASTADLAQWAYQVLHEDNSIFFSKELKTSKYTAVGFGWDINTEVNGRDIFTKGSSIGGFNAQIIMIPASKMAVIVLSNINSDFNCSKIAMKLARWLDKRDDLSLKVPIHLKMAKRIEETNDIPTTIALFKKLKRDAPSSFDFSQTSLLQLGTNLLHKESRIDQAVELLKFCVEEFPQSAKLRLTLAEGYLQRNDLKSCRENIAKAMLAPEDTVNRSAQMRYLSEKIEILEEKKQIIKK